MREVARHVVVLRAAFQFERVEAGGQVQRDLAREDEVVGPEGIAFDLLRPLGRTAEVHPAGDRLVGLGIDDGQQQFAVGRVAGRRLEQQDRQAKQK